MLHVTIKRIIMLLITSIKQKIHGGSHVIAQDYTFNQLTYSNLLIKSFVLAEALNRSLDDSSNIGLMIPNVLAAPVSFFCTLH